METLHPQLFSWSISDEWVKDVGKDGAINRELEATLGPRKDGGIFPILERGRGMENLVHILKSCLEELPDSFLINNWIKDSIASAEKSFIEHQVKLPDITQPVNDENTPSDAFRGHAPTQDTIQQKQNLKRPREKVADDSQTQKKGKSKPKKRDTKAMSEADIVDDRYRDLPEKEDTRKGGRQAMSLLAKITRISVGLGSSGKDEGKTVIHCICSRYCDQKEVSAKELRNKQRILKHAASCGWLGNINGGVWKTEAIQALAAKAYDSNDEECDSGHENTSGPAKRKHSNIHGDEYNEPPPRKQKNDAGSAEAPIDLDEPITPEDAKRKAASSGSSFKDFKTRGRQQLEASANHNLVQLVACNGLPFKFIGSEEFRKFCAGLNGHYHVPSPTTFSDSLLPNTAARVLLKMLDYLREFHHLQISFDGGKLRRKGFYTVTVTTPHRQSFTIELDDGTRLSHTAKYVMEILEKWVTAIGPYRFSGTSSDSTAVTLKARRDLCSKFPHILNMNDACHNLQNTMKDIYDVYRYWLAILAQLHDLFQNGKHKLEIRVIEQIRTIVNRRYSELIENSHAQNIYLTAFFLAPENRSSEILKRPNPLAVPTIILSIPRSTDPNSRPPITLKQSPSTVQKIGVSLLGILRKEYDDVYHPEVSLESARKEMANRNPYLAKHTPAEALAQLKSQLSAYMNGESPFVFKQSFKGTVREWWIQLARHDEADVLAAIAIKIFSALPTSMTEERAVSIVTWMNSARRNHQSVAMVSHLLRVRQWYRMDVASKTKERLSVKWRDLPASIHRPLRSRATPPIQTPNAADQPVSQTTSTESTSKGSAASDEDNDEEDVGDALSWLDDIPRVEEEWTSDWDSDSTDILSTSSFKAAEMVDITHPDLLNILSDAPVRRGGTQTAIPVIESGRTTSTMHQAITMEDAIPAENDWMSFVP
ncbi:hypothetical protein E1B28_002913 [Marasmius oreades]|uniref:DUF659 domain-containing protein n=1 Tax=Marasmius oreades TaxID=181124 RepID=A0A9P7RKC7_9AGAR|nr:uncharacterized protein E1B28_002913 [Marasmius oreades]KAG7085347.1 hypothetical protein E1B28_002913 [Marasmius oreades]